ncbi:MAG: hypothetical protein ACSHYA_07415 [Opitutaceae bacterium]
MSETGIHEGVLGPLRRAATKLNWIIIVRPIKASAMFHCGDFDKLPKPMGIKAKCHPKTGMVMLKNEADFKAALTDKRIDPNYSHVHGLHLDPTPVTIAGTPQPLHYLVNKKGQRYYSDMDLYDVLSGTTGKQVILGTGNPDTPHSGINWRRELDILVNIMRPLGTDFALIDHGPQRQWVRHDHGTPWHEPLSVFCPDGEVFVLQPGKIEEFIRSLA